MKFNYYEGNFTELPDFSNLNPSKSGIVTYLDPEKITVRMDHYAIQYNGYVEIPETGLYTFFLRSDDGSKLYINGKLVVDNDGSHSARTKKGMMALEKGFHSIHIEYFEDFLGQELRLFYEGPGFKRVEIPVSQFVYKD